MFTKHSDHLSNGNAAGMPNQTGHHHCFLLLEGMEKKGCEKLYAGTDQLTFLRVLKEIGRWHIKAYFF